MEHERTSEAAALERLQGAKTEVWCFGSNDTGQLGLGNDADATVPQLAEDISKKNFTCIATGAKHCCACTFGGEVFTWGSHEEGQLGRTGRQMVAQRLESLSHLKIVQSAAGEAHSLALDSSGNVYAWGRNDKGQLGTGDYKASTKPRRVKTDDRHIVQIQSGGHANLALTSSGEVLAWGDGVSGQMGNGDVISYSVPTPIAGLMGTPIVALSVGAGHCVALTVSGSVFSWGSNKFGQLGLGDTRGRRDPVLIPKLHCRHIKKVSCGAFHTAAISDSGKLYTWGQGSLGQLAHGGTNHEMVPRVVAELLGSNVITVACGRAHTLALVWSHDQTHTTLYAWGRYVQGASSSLPLRVDNSLFSISSAHHISNSLNEAEGDHQQEKEENMEESMKENGKRERKQHDNDDDGGEKKQKMELEQDTPSQEQHSSSPEVWVASKEKEEEEEKQEEANETSIHHTASHENHNDHKDEASTNNPLPAFRSNRWIVDMFCDGSDHSFIIIRPKEYLDGVTAKSIEMETETIEQPRHFLSPIQQQHVLYKPQTLHLSPIQRLLNAAWTPSHVLEVKTILSLVFSSPSCLNASFLLDAPTHMNTSETETTGIDLVALRASYAAILEKGSTMDPSLVNTFGNATARLIAALPNIPNPARLPERLRAIVMVLENRLLLDTEHSHVMVERLCRALIGLFSLSSSTSAKRVLGEWWKSLLPVDHFQRVVNVFERYLTFLLTTKTPPQDPTSVTLTLDFLYKINEEKGHIIPYSHFYNAAVSEEVDLEKDYIKWRSSNERVFAFCRYPFLLNAVAKTKILHIDARFQMQAHVNRAFYSAIVGQQPSYPHLILIIRREHIVEDAVSQLSGRDAELKKPLKVIFAGEEGIDEGGITKEFFALLIAQLFDPDYGMFTINSLNNYLFNPASFETTTEYNLIGKIFGLAIYNRVILNVRFPIVVYKKLLGNESTELSDLKDSFPEIHNSLVHLLQYEGDVEDVFGLTFQISYEFYGEARSHDLKEGGQNIPVTNQNRQEFVRLYTKYLLHDSIQTQFNAFSEGFNHMCGGEVLKLFREEELELLVCGSSNYDFHDLEKVTQYKAPFHKDHPVIRYFWEVIYSFSSEEQRLFLVFVTGTDRVPIKGLSSLNFVVQKAGDDVARLPAAHTCYNILDLPEYDTKERLAEKLRLAIYNTQGFGLV